MSGPVIYLVVISISGSFSFTDETASNFGISADSVVKYSSG
jgi:hypothetical protein